LLMSMVEPVTALVPRLVPRKTGCVACNPLNTNRLIQKGGPPDWNRTSIPRLGGMCTIHCATGRTHVTPLAARQAGKACSSASGPCTAGRYREPSAIIADETGLFGRLLEVSAPQS